MKKIILALSGGADSLFLGEKLLAEGAEIIAAHFDHCLRNDSAKDAEFCKKWSKEKGIVFETEQWKYPQKSEEKARTARYDFLEKIRQKHNAKHICTAHHADDQAETILFRFLRGSGIKGLSGMQEYDPDRKILRPLLHTKKSDILAELKRQNIAFCHDKNK